MTRVPDIFRASRRALLYGYKETHALDMTLIFELYKGTPRQGPGNAVSTRRAFAMIPRLPERPRTLDVGCGSGAQTRDLARLTGGPVVAVDIHLPFLERLKSSITKPDGRPGRVHPVAASMVALPFKDGAFDLVWSEGAIYIMGFAEGLRSWRRLLRPGGYLVVSEATWLRGDPPAELRRYWAAGYPAMTMVEADLSAIRAEGYEPLGHFALPESAWLEDYYGPLEKRLAEFRAANEGHAEAQALVAQTEQEIALYRRFSAWFGYVFYAMRKGS